MPLLLVQSVLLKVLQELERRKPYLILLPTPLTHLDFLIYNKLGKISVLAIEVDGFDYHKFGTRQEERDRVKDKILEEYNVPLLRFATNGSNEKMKLTKKLSEIQN